MLYCRFNNGTKFDIIIYEALYPSILGLSHYFGNPHIVGVVTLTAHFYSDYMTCCGVNPSYVPNYLLNYSDKMTFFERLHNFLIHSYSFYLHTFYILPDQDKFMKKYIGKNLPSSLKIISNVSLFIYSSDLSVEYPRALQPNSIHVGAMHIRSPGPLPSVSMI